MLHESKGEGDRKTLRQRHTQKDRQRETETEIETKMIYKVFGEGSFFLFCFSNLFFN